jgi:HK97 family phage prohead protease
MEKLEFAFDYKEVGPAGEFEGWASTYDLDLGNDKILPGAFKTTLRKTAGKVPVLFNHDRNRIVGMGLEAQEDQRGLYVKAKLAMGTQLGRETHELMSLGALKGLSIGYSLEPKGWVMDGTVRLLKSVNLHEYSATPFPMNTQAQISRVKSVETMTEREFEETLRDLGFSKSEARSAVSKIYKRVMEDRRRDADSDRERLEERWDAGSGHEVEINADALEQWKSQINAVLDDVAAKSWLESMSHQPF